MCSFSLSVLALVWGEFGHRVYVNFGTRLASQSKFWGDRFSMRAAKKKICSPKMDGFASCLYSIIYCIYLVNKLRLFFLGVPWFSVLFTTFGLSSQVTVFQSFFTTVFCIGFLIRLDFLFGSIRGDVLLYYQDFCRT